MPPMIRDAIRACGWLAPVSAATSALSTLPVVDVVGVPPDPFWIVNDAAWLVPVSVTDVTSRPSVADTQLVVLIVVPPSVNVPCTWACAMSWTSW